MFPLLSPRQVAQIRNNPDYLPKKTRGIALFILSCRPQHDRLALKPNEQRTAELSFVPREPGLQQGRFEISEDRFPDDDSYLFTLSVRPQVPVVLVNGRPAADPFQNEALYARAALTSTVDESPAAQPGGAPARPIDEFQRSLDVQEIPETGLNQAVLKQASVAILANCGGLNATHFAWLREFVSDGGGLLIFPGDLVAPKIYNEQFFPVPGPQQETLTAARLSEATGDPARPSTFERLAAVDFRHPVLTVFDEPQARSFATVRFFRCFPLRLPERSRNGWPPMRFASGAAALVESRLGEGMVVTAAFPLNTRWTNLPLKPEFVPLLLRLVNHVQRRPEISAPPNLASASAAEIAVPEDWGTATGTLTDPGGQSFPLKFRRADRRLVATSEEPRRKGYSKVEVKGGPANQPRTASTVVAANVAPEESDFTPMTREALHDLMPQARLTVVDASAEAQQLHGAIGDEREVWRPLIWLLFLVIGVEFALATLGPGSKNDPWTRFWEQGRGLLRRRDQVPKPGRRLGRRQEPEPVGVA
ncbi:hypothetical protein HQ590_02465 [bacterium]|nr:hypothetical protein [bacterium]